MLHCAVFNGHLNIVDFILEVDRSAIHTVTNDGKTCLHLAAEKGHTNIIQHLLRDEPNSRNSSYHT